jgi:hypothetical protein
MPNLNTMLRKAFLCALVLTLLAGCKEQTDQSTSKVSLLNTPEGKGVEDRLRMYYTDLSSRDWEKFRTHFWKDATITTAWKAPGDSLPAVDVTTIDDFIKEAPLGPGSQPVFEEKMKDSRVQVQGNIAEAWVEYEAKFGKPDSLLEWSGTDVFTFFRHNGEWKIVSLVFEAK